MSFLRRASLVALAVFAPAAVPPASGQPYGESPYIFGVHEPGGAPHMADKRKGWILFTEELGHDPANGSGRDYRPWADQGYGIIVRLNHGYGPSSGTLPYVRHYAAFAQRVARFVAASPGAHIWIVANETNLSGEWPRYEGAEEEITPERYVQAFRQVRSAIKGLAGHAGDQVIPAPSGTYAPPTSGGLSYVQYHVRILELLGPGGLDAIALHAYTHGTHPSLVFDESRMGPPYQAYRYNFRAYRDYLNAHPTWARNLPVYITETDQIDRWADTNSGWVRNAYREINDWNQIAGTQKVRSLLLYRFCLGCDQWDITGKGGVIADFRQAMDNDYRWTATTPGTCQATVPADHWRAEYFANPALSGAPALTRDEGIAALNLDWGLGGPSACGVGTDGFSARFTRTVFFNAGTYRFTTTADDGVRLYVDGSLKVDRWIDQGPTTYTADVVLAAGNHTVVMHYYENGGGAVAKVGWALVGPGAEALDAKVLATSALPAGLAPGETRPVTIRVQNTGTETWTAASLVRLGAAAGNTVAWGSFSCDGYFVNPTNGRAFLCGAVAAGGTAELTFNVTAPATGPAVLSVQMVKDGARWFGESRAFTIPGGSSCTTAVGASRWKGEYFPNPTLTGTPSLVRDEGAAALAIDWGLAGPNTCGIGADRFSARYTRTASFSAGTYRFTVTGDDGVRLYVDGSLKIDRWIDQAPTTYTADVVLTAGNHAVRLDYYENAGGAVARLDWARIGGEPTGASKLTVHTSFTGGLSMAFVRDAKPRLLKILDNLGPAAEVKAASPGTLIVGRIYETVQPNDGDPAVRAQEWWSRNRDRILAHPAIDYWEGYNEPDASTVERIAWYARFEAARVSILAQHGRRACIGNFSMGTPDVTNPSAWPAFYPAIDAARANGGILGLHEYGTPMQQHFDPAAGEGWLCGRYRKVYRQFLIPSGRSLPLAITEAGVDGVSPVGWKNHFTGDQYLEQLKWYDSLMRADPYVLGATVFSLEIPSWESFDVAPIMGPLTDHVRVP